MNVLTQCGCGVWQTFVGEDESCCMSNDTSQIKLFTQQQLHTIRRVWMHEQIESMTCGLWQSIKIMACYVLLQQRHPMANKLKWEKGSNQ